MTKSARNRCQTKYLRWDGNECVPRLHLSVATEKAQQGGGYGRVWAVVYEGQPIMASTLDREKAVRVLQREAKRLKMDTPLIEWDGDLGMWSD